MITVFLVVLLISIGLALKSVVSEQAQKDWQRVAHKFRQEKIKGGIVLEKGKQPKHYSSYS